ALPHGTAPQLDAALAPQHVAAIRREAQPAMALHVDDQEAHGDELAEHRTPFLRRQLLPDSVGTEVVVTELSDLLRIAAAQHIDHVAGAEALSRAVDAGERLAHGLAAVEGLGRLQAGIAVAAGLIQRLAEIGEQHLATAARRLAIADERLELAPLDPFLGVGRV